MTRIHTRRWHPRDCPPATTPNFRPQGGGAGEGRSGGVRVLVTWGACRGGVQEQTRRLLPPAGLVVIPCQEGDSCPGYQHVVDKLGIGPQALRRPGVRSSRSLTSTEGRGHLPCRQTTA